MIPAFTGLFNHLWQSTLFAGAAGLLTIALRKNHARARHWVWFIASVKFLVPFSLLTGFGGHLGWSVPSAETPQFSYVLEQIGEPLAQPPVRVLAAPAATVTNLLPSLAVAVWAAGFLALVGLWWTRWRRIRAAVRAASPLSLPMETRLPARASAGLLEPGVFGIFRPVLLLPEGILDRLPAGQLKAIVAHEWCHVKRRDNLAAAIHMLVEAVFWFHPLVWWMGRRMLEERERACDEEVLLRGAEPQVYAESILTVCEFCLASPVACVSGVSGADLKKRIERIMMNRIGRTLGFGTKLLLGAAGLAAVAGPVAVGMLNAPAARAQTQSPGGSQVEFEVASIKPAAPPATPGRIMTGMRGGPGTPDPGRMTFSNVSLKQLVQSAYDVKSYQISGPNWLESERFDVLAKVPAGTTKEQARLMLQNLLAERFKLKLHHSTKELPIYELAVAKNGPKLKESTDESTAAPLPGERSGYDRPGGSPSGPRMMMMFTSGRMRLSASGQTMAGFVDALAMQVERPVVDMTGLKGKYDIDLEFAPDMARMQSRMAGLGAMPAPGGPGGGGPAAAAPDAQSAPSLFSALPEQLGLKLESKKGPVDLLVIDSVDKTPTEN